MHACTHINEYDCNRLSAEESYKDLEICIQQQVLDQNEVIMALNTKLKESRKAGDTLNQKVNFTTFTRLLYIILFINFIIFMWKYTYKLQCSNCTFWPIKILADTLSLHLLHVHNIYNCVCVYVCLIVYF